MNTNTKPVRYNINHSNQKLANKVGNRLLDWGNYTLMPFVCKSIIVLGFAYAVVTNLARFNALPETAQGAIAVVVIAIVIKVATNKKED